VFEFLSYDFMRYAVYTGILSAVICGLIGPFVVVRRLVFISGGISHITFGGLGLFYFLSLPPLYGAFSAAILTAFFLNLRRGDLSGSGQDANIGILWSLGMAVGILFISLTPGFAPNLMTYLFGNILTVSREAMLLTLVLTLAVLVLVTVFYKEMVAVSFDPEFSRVQGLPVDRLNLLLLVLISIAIVTLIQVVGIILVIAMLTIPTLIALRFARHFHQAIILSILAGILITLSGLWLSFMSDLPSGPVIIITGALVLGIVTGIKKAEN